uniref:Reverse transcriptase zinc-binding domain-containing protein n=1 Tax=Chenopodium quinoa TaxID=63459 RepID=A0A803LJK3_CHEQI
MLDTVNYFERGKRSNLFRFEALWLSKKECGTVIEKAWMEGAGSAPHECIDLCARELKKWASKTFGDIKKRIRSLEKEQLEAQSSHIDAMMISNCDGEEDMLVRDLMSVEGREWDMDKIEPLFPVDLRPIILAIPLSNRVRNDVLLWKCSKDGLYTVRTGYWLAKMSSVKGNLAVRDRLVHRDILQDASCHICGGERETIIHLVLECIAAKEIWAPSEFQDCLVGAPRSSFADLWLWLVRKHKADVVASMVTLMWAAWRCRNLIIF